MSEPYADRLLAQIAPRHSLNTLMTRKMRILFVGNSKPTQNAMLKADALTRIGHSVFVVDPYAEFQPIIAASRLRSALHYRTGYRFLQRKVLQWTRKVIEENREIDAIWVEGGELFGPDCVSAFSSLAPVVLSTPDDPTGTRDGGRFASLKRALRHYTACAVRIEKNPREYYALGCQHVIHVYMTYDEVAHRPFDDINEIPAEFRSEVAFVGTWIPGENRDQLLLRLIERGVPLSIWGKAWHRSPVWQQLQPHWRSPAVWRREYVAVMQGAKVMIGMLSHQNRDQHTKRSFEVPYAGGVLCAERTPEHLKLYREGTDALFWSSADECADHCLRLLADEGFREGIRRSGMARVRELGVGNEPMCEKVLQALLAFSKVRAGH